VGSGSNRKSGPGSSTRISADAERRELTKPKATRIIPPLLYGTAGLDLNRKVGPNSSTASAAEKSREPRERNYPSPLCFLVISITSPSAAEDRGTVPSHLSDPGAGLLMSWMLNIIEETLCCLGSLVWIKGFLCSFIRELNLVIPSDD